MIPTKFEGQLFIFARQYNCERSPELVITSDDCTSFDHYELIGMASELSIDIPQIDLTSRQVDKLRKKKDKIIAEATEKAEAIEQQIKELTAIGVDDE